MAKSKQQLIFDVEKYLSDGSKSKSTFETSIFGEGNPSQKTFAEGLAQGGVNAEWDESLGGYVKKYGDGGYAVYKPADGYEKVQAKLSGDGFTSTQYVRPGEDPVMSSNIDSAGQRATRLSDPSASAFTKKAIGGSSTDTSQSGIITDNVTGKQYQMGSNGYYVPLNSTLNVNTLGGSSRMSFPDAPVLNTKADTATAGATAYSTQYDSDIKSAQKEEAKNQKSYDQLSSEISKLLGTTTGKGEEQLKEEAKNNVPELTSQLNNLNNQIKIGLAEYAQLQNTYDKVSAENKNRPVTMDSIIGSERAINEKRVLELNGKAADIGLLQAQAQGLQGNLEQAQKTADRAVDLKYADATALINVKIQQLDMIRDSLTASEKKTAALLDRQYQAQRDQIELQIANQKDLNATLLNAMSSYPDAKITLQDTIESANAKIVANSKIYADKIRQPAGSGNSVTGTINGKPQTIAQTTAQGYADRLAQSNQSITSLGDKFTGKLSGIGGVLPNQLKSSDRQVYEQAQRNFITALLRRESGAAISDSEFDTAKKQYFPQPGDGADVVTAKEANRNLVINNFFREANVQRTAYPGDIIDVDGVKYRVDLDGETLIEL